MKIAVALGTLATAFLLALPASATKFKFAGDLQPGNEVAPPNVAGHAPNGGAVFLYDDQTKLLCGNIEWDDLTSTPPTGVHVHMAPKTMPNANGAPNDKVVLPVTAIATSPASFKVILNTVWATALMSGEIYANVHTTANKDGEIRGTMDPFPEGFEVDCPAGDPLPLGVVVDAGAPVDASVTPPPANTSSASSASSSSGDTKKPAPEGLKAEETPPAPPEASGCNSSTSSPANVLSIGLVVGFAVLAVGSRHRRKRK